MIVCVLVFYLTTNQPVCLIRADEDRDACIQGNGSKEMKQFELTEYCNKYIVENDSTQHKTENL